VQDFIAHHADCGLAILSDFDRKKSNGFEIFASAGFGKIFMERQGPVIEPDFDF
jgi:hypothetical protein